VIGVETYDLYIPELMWRPMRSILNCPERIYVAWHRQAEGIHDLLDEQGHDQAGGVPRDSLWEVREYVRAIHYPNAAAYYERVTS
jgi:hypothetical protein